MPPNPSTNLYALKRPPPRVCYTCLVFFPPPSGREKRRKKFNPVRGIEQQSDQLGVIALRDSANKNWKNTYKSFFVPSNNKNISLIILFYLSNRAEFTTNLIDIKMKDDYICSREQLLS